MFLACAIAMRSQLAAAQRNSDEQDLILLVFAALANFIMLCGEAARALAREANTWIGAVISASP